MSGLATYLPASIVEYYLSHGDDIPFKPPFRHRYKTVALFADVSGYTAMCEAMSAIPNNIGDEMLARHLNSYYEQLVRIVSKEGGDVFKFAGDAIIVLWPQSEEDLETLTRRAAQCALEIDNQMQNIRMSDDVVLCIKVGVGVGDLSILHVGGVFNRLEYVAIGIPLVQAFNAEHHIVQKEVSSNGGSGMSDASLKKIAMSASPSSAFAALSAGAPTGQCVMSPESWEIVKDYFVADIKDDHAFLKSCKKRLTSQSIAYTAGGGQTLSEKTVAQLKNYVPSAVMPWLDVKEEKWASELRLITVLFVNLGLSEAELLRITKEDDIDTVQTILEVVQQSVYRYEGSLNKFLMDDKGSTLLAVFGLPPLAHEDDSVRGILAAINIISNLRKLHFTASCGISSGRAYCGIVGNRARREYSVLGDTVNLAARLMQHATANHITGGVVCDLSTQYLARHRFQFDPLQPIKVKGKSTQISLYRPLPKIRTRDPWALHGMIKPLNENMRKKSTHSSSDEDNERKTFHAGLTPSSVEDSQSFLGREASFIEEVNESETDITAITHVMARLTALRESGAPFVEWFPRVILEAKEESEEVAGLRHNANQHLSSSSIPNEFVISLDREDQILRHTHTVLAAHANLLNTGKGVTMIIQGEMGMGKSRLLFSCLQEIPRSTSSVVNAEGNPFDVHTPLSVWKDIILQLLDSRIPEAPVDLIALGRGSIMRNGRSASAAERPKSNSFLRGRLSTKTSEKSIKEFSPMVVVEEDGDTEGLWIAKARRTLVLKTLKGCLYLDDASLESLAAVLNSVLPVLAFRESVFSESLDVPTKLKYAQNLLVIIFSSFTKRCPCVIAIEDAVFLDHESWSFLLQLSRLQLRALFLLATRPINKLYMSAFATSVPEAYLQLLREPLTVVLQLERWSSEEINEMSKAALAEILSVDLSTIDVPVKLLDLLKVKAQGCPLVVREMVWNLKKKGYIGVMPLSSPNNRQREIVVSPGLFGQSSRESESNESPMKDVKAGHRTKAKNRSIFHTRGPVEGINFSTEKDQEIESTKSKDAESVVPLIPQSLEPVLGCQLDRLTSTQSMTLKTGAVIAYAFAKNCFSLQWVIETYPVTYPDYNCLKNAILALVDLKIIEPVREVAVTGKVSWDMSYSFTHGFMRDMILSRMLSAQKVTIAAELQKLRGSERFSLIPKLEPASIVGPLYVLSYGDSLGRPDELIELSKERRPTNMSQFVDDLDSKKDIYVCWAEVNQASAIWGVAWFSLHGGVLVMWPSEQAAQAADDPNSEHQPLVVIFPREASVSELMKWTSHTPVKDEKELELPGGGGPTIKHLRNSLPQQVRSQTQDFTFLLRARYFMWDGCYYTQAPYVFQVGANSLKEAEAWLGSLRSAISLSVGAPSAEQPVLTIPAGQSKDMQAQEEAALIAEIESKAQNIVIQPTCLLVQKQLGYMKFAGLWKKSWLTLTNQALYLRKKNVLANNPKWTKPNSVLNLMVGEPQAKMGQLETAKNKIYSFTVSVDMWRKDTINNWEHRVFVFGCEKIEEAQKWVSLINRVVSDNVSRRQKSSTISRTTFALDPRARDVRPKTEGKDANWARRVPSAPEHEHSSSSTEYGDEQFTLMLDGKIQLNPRQKKRIWERGAQILGLIEHALKLTETSNKKLPLQTADPEGDIQRLQLGIILRDLRSWASAVLSTNLAVQRSRTGSFLSSTFGDRVFTRGGRWMEKNFEDLVNCVDETSREWLSQVYTKQKTLDFSHAPLLVGGYRTVKVFTSYQIESWENFDVFAISDKEMIPVVISLLESFDIPRGLNIPRDILVNWLSAVQLMYGNNPYHNFRHAVDVCQTTYVLLRSKRMEHLSLLDKAAMLISALCHDLGHPGLTNEYHKNALSEMALIYNDRSVLENHHCSQTFRLLKRPELNIFVNLSPTDFTHMRTLMLTLILSTDNANHFKLFRKLTEIFDADSFGEDEDYAGKTTEETEARKEEKRIVMCGVLHAADISNPCKPWKLSSRWSQNIGEEFFLQGDLEKMKGLKVSPNCDRLTTVPLELSLNFLDFIVAPLFFALGRWMPEGIVWINLIKENRKELEKQRAAQSGGADAQKWTLREEGFARLLLTSKRPRAASAESSDLSSASEADFRQEKSHSTDKHENSISREKMDKKEEDLSHMPHDLEVIREITPRSSSPVSVSRILPLSTSSLEVSSRPSRSSI